MKIQTVSRHNNSIMVTLIFISAQHPPNLLLGFLLLRQLFTSFFSSAITVGFFNTSYYVIETDSPIEILIGVISDSLLDRILNVSISIKDSNDTGSN